MRILVSIQTFRRVKGFVCGRGDIGNHLHLRVEADERVSEREAQLSPRGTKAKAAKGNLRVARGRRRVPNERVNGGNGEP